MNIYKAILYFFIAAYIFYFSVLTVLRFRTLYASYYDLGIMDQTVYNTYQSIKTGDWSRFMELTDPHDVDQAKRMAIHNDLILALLAPFYFIHQSPSTLLVIQSIVCGFGAWFVFQIAIVVFTNQRRSDLFALLLSILYLLHPTLQRANIFDFHAVTLATTFLLGMWYFWLKKNYIWSFIFFVLSILSKEQVGLTTALFGLYVLFDVYGIRYSKFRLYKTKKPIRSDIIFALSIIGVSIVWFVLSVWIIIPFFNGKNHFATVRYGDLGDSPSKIVQGFIRHPIIVWKSILRWDTFRYVWFLLGPVGFISIISPLQLIISAPEFMINLLSNDSNMRNVIYHYTAVIQPFILISAIYGLEKISRQAKKHINLIVFCLIVCSVAFAYFKGPLPYSREQEIHPFKYPQKEQKITEKWSNFLKDDSIKISTTGHIAPYFTEHRYFYDFTQYYSRADYVIITKGEIEHSQDHSKLIPLYQKLIHDPKYVQVENQDGVEVYKNVTK